MMAKNVDLSGRSAEVLKLPKERQRAPFVPLTGNPEINGDYLEYYEQLQKGEVVSISSSKKA